MTDIERKLSELNGTLEELENEEYGAAIERKIRQRYSLSQELSIQRQKERKPQEYEEYDRYCEQCKAEVKTMFNRI